MPLRADMRAMLMALIYATVIPSHAADHHNVTKVTPTTAYLRQKHARHGHTVVIVRTSLALRFCFRLCACCHDASADDAMPSHATLYAACCCATLMLIRCYYATLRLFSPCRYADIANCAAHTLLPAACYLPPFLPSAALLPPCRFSPLC